MNFRHQKLMYKDHQLIGDDQLLRFARNVLRLWNYHSSVEYSVDGQTIQELYDQLNKKNKKLHHSVILMIGRNDLRQQSPVTQMKESYLDVLELLKKSTKKIVLVTIPPIQYMRDSMQHWNTFTDFNKFILQQHNGKQVFVVDFAQHLVGYGGVSGCMGYYQQTYAGHCERHLNKKGLLLLKFCLDLHYF